MNPWLFGLVALLLVPFQITLIDSLSPFGFRPDVCLVVVCVTGFRAGPVQGGVLGLMIGIGQGLFSAGGFLLNLITKGLIGLAAGFVAKNLTNMTPFTIFFPMVTFSILSGVVVIAASRFGMPLMDVLELFPSQVLPQALLDGLLGTGLNWVVTHLNRNTMVLALGRRQRL